jgi:hypothetical protein
LAEGKKESIEQPAARFNLVNSTFSRARTSGTAPLTHEEEHRRGQKLNQSGKVAVFGSMQAIVTDSCRMI